jgi:two-component system response regulator QseB
MHVLLVEDDDLIADGIIAGLALHGFQVEWLADGLRAKMALKDDSLDLLILDLGLPRLDGLKVLQALRADGSVLPTLVLTALDSVEQRVEALDELAAPTRGNGWNPGCTAGMKRSAAMRLRYMCML